MGSETCQRKATELIVIDAATGQLLSECTNRQHKSFESTIPLFAGVAVIVHPDSGHVKKVDNDSAALHDDDQKPDKYICKER